MRELEQLHAAVESLVRRESFSEAVGRLSDELGRSTAPFVWSTLALEGLVLPDAIRSGWIFLLRGGAASGCHLHPNSVQHMVALDGRGRSVVGGVEREIVPFGSAGRSIDEQWFVIAAGVPHEFFPRDEDMTVVSFHTCAANELEEVDCASGASRRYEPAADAP